MPHKYPQVTQAQLELWLTDPTTRKYFQCLAWHVEQNVEFVGGASFISDDSSKTYAQLIGLIGERGGLELAIDYESIFKQHDMLEPHEDIDDGEEI